MGKPKVLLLGNINDAKEAWADFEQNHAEVIVPQSKERAEFLEECKSGKLDGVVACFRTFGSVSTTGLWNEELAKVLPKSLKYISHCGAGYDQITVAPFSERKTLITNVPTAVDDATADTALFLTLGALRQYNAPIFDLRAGKWTGPPYWTKGHDPQGAVLGILGMGGIGKNYAFKAKALGMKIQYHNRRKIEDDPEIESKLEAKYVSFEELLATSDVISVHMPLNDKTKHTLNKETLAKCKKGVVIVNTARGGVIDEGALVEALESGQVGSVGLDVFEAEPKVHEGLVKNDRAFLLPHLGTWTYETARKMEEWNMNNVKCALAWEAGDVDQGKRMSVVSEQKDLWQNMLTGK